MTVKTIAILMPGDMGHAVGRALKEHGFEVVCALEGRGEHTQILAGAAGLRDVDTLRNVVEVADLILSILPPAAAVQQAERVAREMNDLGKRPIYVDCNAISPETAKNVAAVIEGANGVFIDAGIIGLAPGKGAGPRFYVSGPDVGAMLDLDGKGFRVLKSGDNIGEASALKMTYAGLTKGTWTLQTAVLLAAQKLGVIDTLLEEFEFSQSGPLDAMRARHDGSVKWRKSRRRLHQPVSVQVSMTVLLIFSEFWPKHPSPTKPAPIWIPQEPSKTPWPSTKTTCLLTPKRIVQRNE